ncbi:MAG: acyl-CoA thioesterase [Candidatus Methylomirabilales bacterium]
MTDARNPQAKPVSASRVVLSHVMNPADANPLGSVHGGVILRLVDEAGGVAAVRHARRPAVTVAMDSMTFRSPVPIGSLVTFKASVNYAGTTSMEVGVRVETENLLTGEVRHTSSAYLVYVALDEQGQPSPVPRLIPETEEDRRRIAAAEARMAARLRQRKG